MLQCEMGEGIFTAEDAESAEEEEKREKRREKIVIEESAGKNRGKVQLLQN